MPLTRNTTHSNDLNSKIFYPVANMGVDMEHEDSNYNSMLNNCSYTSIVNQTTLKAESNTKLNILHVNCRSIYSDDKFDDFLLFLQRTDANWSIICISETWLRNDVQSKKSIAGYNAYFENRSDSLGGGVAIYVRCDIESCLLKPNHSITCTESVFVDCKLSCNVRFTIGVVYRPPKLHPGIFTPELERCLEDITAQNNSIIICGDFNFDLFKASDDSNVEHFLNTFLSHGFLPTISKATRVSSDCSSLIDNIFCNNIRMINKSSIIFDDSSDHFPIYVTCNILNKKQIHKRSERTVFNFKRLLDLRSYLKDKLTNFNHLTDPETACDQILDAYKKGMEKFSITVKPNRKTTPVNPWITPAILSSINKRHELFTIKCKNPSAENVRKYQIYRNKLTNIIRIAKQNFYRTKLEENKDNPREVWNIINSVSKGRCISNEDVFPSSFKGMNGEQIKDDKKIANDFNAFFSSIGKKLQENIPSRNELPTDNITKVADVTLNHFEPTDVEEVTSLLQSMKNVGAGLDKINARIFKGTYKVIIKEITHFVNLCLQNGVFPKQLKIALIKPIYKSGEKDVFGNYRPISILPYISKLLEKIIHTRLMDFLTENSIINQSQFGFQKGLSTYMPILLLQENITKAFEKGNATCGIYLDLKKAFDTVDIKILVDKIEKYGIKNSALKILRSYLSERKQCVKINERISGLLNTNIGVPQGSILGPLLFIIYINDLPNVLSNGTCLLYADDTAIFFEGDDEEQLQKSVNEEMLKINNWMQINKLSLNMNKTVGQLYSNNSKVKDITVTMNNIKIKFVETVKYLGIFIDSKLTWCDHITSLASVISRNVGILYRSSFVLGREPLLLLYNSLILAHINYCCVVWGLTFPSLLHKIEILQKKAVRIITASGRLAHSEPLFKSLKVLKIMDIAKQQAIILLHKKTQGTLPYTLDRLFEMNESHSIATRNIKHIKEPFSHKLYKTHTASWTGPRVWNSVMVPIFPAIEDVPSSKGVIKKISKNYFLQSYDQF